MCSKKFIYKKTYTIMDEPRYNLRWLVMLKTKYEKYKKRCLACYASYQMYLSVEEMQNIWLKKFHLYSFGKYP